jgi:RNA polymerase sigma-70 factor, ECF subfamily
MDLWMNMAATLPDERLLLLRTSRGDRQAFEQLYLETSPTLYAVALRLLRQREAAEEVVQEVFMTLWHAAGQYDTKRGSVRTWLTTITRNRCIDRLRRPANQQTEDYDDDMLSTPEHHNPLHQVVEDDDRSVLLGCMQTLTEQQQRCIALAYFDGMTHQEVSSELTIPLGSAKTWIRRGLDALKKCMEAL